MQLDSIEDIQKNISLIEKEIRKRIVGMDHVVKLLLVGIFASPGRNCHVLIEGVPGLAKTLLLKSFAESVDGEFKRISFAADLLPKDVVGD